jgi:hypothetical protein
MRTCRAAASREVRVNPSKLFLVFLIVLVPVASGAGACGGFELLGVQKTGGAGGAGAASSASGQGAGPGVGGFSTISIPGGPCDTDATNPYLTHPVCCGSTCGDFPLAPIMADTGVPSNAGALFAGNFTSGSLCMLEPQLSAGGVDGAMMPANWVEPRFRWVAPAGIDLFELRLHTPAEVNDLVVYTTKTAYYLPRDIWSGPPVDGGIASGSGLANNAAGAPITVTIRGVNMATPGMTPVGVTGDFNIAPVIATGSMVFWTVDSGQVNSTSSQLFGFKVGDEGVQVALTLPQLAWTGQPGEDGAELRGYYSPLPGFTTPGQVQCMGCHAGTPDGSAVVFTDNWAWMKGAAVLPGVPPPAVAGGVPTKFGATGTTTPATITFGAGAQSILKTPWWGTQTMSPAHWKPGDAILVSSYGTSFQGSPPSFATGSARTKPWQPLPYYNSSNPFLDDKVNYHQLAWIDMESTTPIDVAFPVTPDYGTTLTNRESQATAAQGSTWGIIPTGDSMSDVMPSLSNLATTDRIVYTESDFTPDGHPDYTATVARIRTVPYKNRAGGASQLLDGASDSAHLNYYPSYSADDAFIAFTQAPVPSATSPDGPYYNRFGKVMIVPAAGGTAIPLAANDPNTCAGDNLAAGIINSWPKWSPDVVPHPNGKTYYFLIFSSARKYGDEFSLQFSIDQNPMSDFMGLHTSSQLYLAAVVVDNATKQAKTYPAVYIWNQNRTPGSDSQPPQKHSNLTPAWAPFALPPLVFMKPPT